MKAIIHLLAAFITCALALGFAVIAWYVFNLVHFFATDAAYTMRQQRWGDTPHPPFWKDFLGYLHYYIPVLLIGFFSLLCGYLSYRSFKCLGFDESSVRSDV